MSWDFVGRTRERREETRSQGRKREKKEKASLFFFVTARCGGQSWVAGKRGRTVFIPFTFGVEGEEGKRGCAVGNFGMHKEDKKIVGGKGILPNIPSFEKRGEERSSDTS